MLFRCFSLVFVSCWYCQITCRHGQLAAITPPPFLAAGRRPPLPSYGCCRHFFRQHYAGRHYFQRDIIGWLAVLLPAPLLATIAMILLLTRCCQLIADYTFIDHRMPHYFFVDIAGHYWYADNILSATPLTLLLLLLSASWLLLPLVIIAFAAFDIAIIDIRGYVVVYYWYWCWHCRFLRYAAAAATLIIHAAATAPLPLLSAADIFRHIRAITLFRCWYFACWCWSPAFSLLPDIIVYLHYSAYCRICW